MVWMEAAGDKKIIKIENIFLYNMHDLMSASVFCILCILLGHFC